MQAAVGKPPLRKTRRRDSIAEVRMRLADEAVRDPRKERQAMLRFLAYLKPYVPLFFLRHCAASPTMPSERRFRMWLGMSLTWWSDRVRLAMQAGSIHSIPSLTTCCAMLRLTQRLHRK